MELHSFYQQIHYTFQDQNLAILALTHPSMNAHPNPKSQRHDYERLEFLGDSVLSMIIAEALYMRHADEDEGSMSQRHASLVCGTTASHIAETLGIPKFIRMAHGEEDNGGRSKAKILENVMEAIIGAVYLDGGFSTVKQFILNHWSTLLQQKIQPPKDPKSQLQEYSQKYLSCLPVYEIVNTTGSEHQPVFTVAVYFPGHDLRATAEGPNKKVAEKLAATRLLQLCKPV